MGTLRHASVAWNASVAEYSASSRLLLLLVYPDMSQPQHMDVSSEPSGDSVPSPNPGPSRLREVTTKNLCEFTNPLHLATAMLDAIKGMDMRCTPTIAL